MTERVPWSQPPEEVAHFHDNPSQDQGLDYRARPRPQSAARTRRAGWSAAELGLSLGRASAQLLAWMACDPPIDYILANKETPPMSVALTDDKKAAETTTTAPTAADETPGMVALSDKAAEKVKEIRAEESIEESYALRLKVQGGGCSGFSYDLYFDQAQDGDKSFDVKGVKLISDQMSLMYLMGTEIDYVEGLHGAGFKFNNPNVKSTCGCGSSFSA